jgi:hypothetical protein
MNKESATDDLNPVVRWIFITTDWTVSYLQWLNAASITAVSAVSAVNLTSMTGIAAGSGRLWSTFYSSSTGRTRTSSE